VTLSVWSLDGSTKRLPKAISVHKRVRERGEESDEYLCQFANNENRAFRDLFELEFGAGAFVKTGFSLKQVGSDAAGWEWLHQTAGKSELAQTRCLTNHYKFVFESEGEGAVQ